MNSYAAYLAAIASTWTTVLELAAIALLAIMVTWAAGLWLPALLTQPSTTARPTPPQRGQHGLALASGLASFGLVWSLAAYAGPSQVTVLAVAVILPLAGLAFAHWRDYRPAPPGRHLLLAGATGLALSLWLYLPTDLVVPETGLHVFSDLQFDLSIHALMAETIRESGLPLHNLWASTASEFSPLSHTAHAVVIAGLAEATSLDSPRAAIILWALATVITLWSAIELIEWNAPVTPASLALCALAVTVWAPLSTFDAGWLMALPAIDDIVGTNDWVAGRSYWNISQALSIALVAAALTVLDRADDVARDSPRRRRFIAAGALLISTSACFKPSLWIFYGPALLLWCGWRRESVRTWLALVVALVVPLFVYALPVWLQPLPAGGRWLIAPDAGQALAVGDYLLRALAAPLVLATALIALRRIPGPASTLGLATLALAGSALFALLFQEAQFVGFEVLQPNIWWGMAACCLLMLPLIGREAVHLVARGGAIARGATVLATGLAVAQLAHGIVIAVAYPLLVVRSYPDASIRLLRQVRAATSPTTRLALDPYLDGQDLRPFLARPSLLPTTFGDPTDLAAYDAWSRFAAEGRGNPMPALARVDAVVLHEQRRAARDLLVSLGWRTAPLTNGFALWQRPSLAGH